MDTSSHKETERPNRDKHQRRYSDEVAIGKPSRSGSSESSVNSDPLGVRNALSRLARPRVGPSLYERLLAEEISIRESFARR